MKSPLHYPIESKGFVGAILYRLHEYFLIDLDISLMAEVRTKPKRLFENHLFYPISVLSEEFNPQNTRCIPLG